MTKVTLLGHGEVTFSQNANGLTVTLPASHTNNTIAPVFEISFAGGQGVESVQQSAISCQKFIENGQVIIVRDNKRYSVLGQIIK